MADIVGVRVAPDLSVIDSLIIICNDAGGQTDPSVVFNGEHYVVAWADAFTGSRDVTLKAVRVDFQGNVLGTGVPFGAGSGMTDIAFDGARCLVVWSKTYQGIYGCFLNDQALPEDTVFRIDTIIGSDVNVHLDYDGANYLVVWSDFDSVVMEQDIYGRLVSPQGAAGERIAITRISGHQVSPDVVFDGVQYLVAWIESSGAIRGRCMTPTGQPVGTIFQVSDTTPYARSDVHCTVGATNYLLVWSEWRTDSDIYGNCDVAVAIREGTASPPEPSYYTTVIAGPLAYDRSTWMAYDVSGRRVPDLSLGKGVYFLRHVDGTVHKVVKVR